MLLYASPALVRMTLFFGSLARIRFQKSREPLGSPGAAIAIREAEEGVEVIGLLAEGLVEVGNAELELLELAVAVAYRGEDADVDVVALKRSTIRCQYPRASLYSLKS
jgi:hypothetical protein